MTSRWDKPPVTAEWLRQKYTIEELSAREIGKLCGRCRQSIDYLLKKYGIPKRTSGLHAGSKNGFYGKKHSDVTKDKLAKASKRLWENQDYRESNSGANHHLYGKSPTKTTRKRRSEALSSYYDSPRGRADRKRRSARVAGENNPAWAGGVTEVQNCIRWSEAYQNWREQVLRRDSYKCTKCSSTDELEIDHIKPLSIIIRENDISNFPEALGCSIIWEAANGRTLCKPCHKKTPTYGAKALNNYE